MLILNHRKEHCNIIMAKNKTNKKKNPGHWVIRFQKNPRDSQEKMDKTGNSLNAPHLADWLTGPCDAQPSYLCSSNHRWSQYRGPCAASGHSVTRWLSRGGTKTPSRRSLRRQVSAVGGMRPLLPRISHSGRRLRRLGLEKPLGRAARRAFPRWPRSWPQGRR